MPIINNNSNKDILEIKNNKNEINNFKDENTGKNDIDKDTKNYESNKVDT